MAETLYALFRLERFWPAWWDTDPATQVEHLNGLQAILTRFPKVRVDHYLPERSDPPCHFAVRLEAEEQDELLALNRLLDASDFYKYINTVQSMAGRTRPPAYASPTQLRELARTAPPPTLKRWAFVIPVRRTPDWWHFPEAERQRLVREHVDAGLAYHPFLHRRCYYCEGLDTQQDFVYYIEANDPEVVTEAYQKLRLLRDANFWAEHRIALQARPMTLHEWMDHLRAGPAAIPTDAELTGRAHPPG